MQDRQDAHRPVAADRPPRSRGGPVSGAPALTHELLLHNTPEEMLAFVVPFVRDGIAAEEPTLLMLRPETAATVLPLVPSSPHLVLLPATGRCASCLSCIRTPNTGTRDQDKPVRPGVRRGRRSPALPPRRPATARPARPDCA